MRKDVCGISDSLSSTFWFALGSPQYGLLRLMLLNPFSDPRQRMDVRESFTSAPQPTLTCAALSADARFDNERDDERGDHADAPPSLRQPGRLGRRRGEGWGRAILQPTTAGDLI